MSQLRNFVFTCNNYTDLSIDKIKGLPDTLKCNYYIYGKEVGEKGTPHLQGYVELEKRVSFKKVTEYLKGFHIEQRKGTGPDAIRYCKKDGVVEVYGVPKNPGQRTDLQTLKAKLQENPSIKALLDDDSIQINYQSLRFAENILKYYDKPRYFKPKVTWYYGDSGAGKTRRAVNEVPEAYFKSNGSGKWWPGYDGEKDIIVDDVESDNYGLKFLLGLTDRYPFIVEGKGGTRQFQGENIYITSLQHPEIEYKSSWNSDKIIPQLLRRIDNLVEITYSQGRGILLPPTSD